MVSDIAPAMIEEGQGDHGSAPALLVIHGASFVNANLQVEIAASNGTTVDLALVDGVAISRDGTYVAFTVAAHVDTALSTDVPLDVTVSQSCRADQRISRTVSGLTLHGLPELTSDQAMTVMTSTLQPKYSMVALSDVTFMGTAAAHVTATSSIALGHVKADASLATGGPGGYSGGASSGSGSGGGGVGGPAVVVGTGGGGGGAGYADDGDVGISAAGTGGIQGRHNGDDRILSYDTSQSSAGGGGGAGLTTLGTSPGGGAGGGGGGTIVLTAGGDITTDTVQAMGGAGGSGAGSGGGGGGGGGGGAGGTVVARTTRGALTTGAIRVFGGAGGTPGGGQGSSGRVRWDAPGGTSPASPDHPAHRGPAFQGPKSVVTAAGEVFQLTGSSGDEFDVRVIDRSGAVHGGEHAIFGSGGVAVITPALQPGYNQLCVTIAGGMPSDPAASTCIDVAFLPDP
jgi:hypothetical protein